MDKWTDSEWAEFRALALAGHKGRDDYWTDDGVMFARLLTAITRAGVHADTWARIVNGMGLYPEDVSELFERAVVYSTRHEAALAELPPCRLCGETIREHQGRAEVIIAVPLGDDEVRESAIVHAECFLDQSAHHDARMWLA